MKASAPGRLEHHAHIRCISQAGNIVDRRRNLRLYSINGESVVFETKAWISSVFSLCIFRLCSCSFLLAWRSRFSCKNPELPCSLPRRKRGIF